MITRSLALDLALLISLGAVAIAGVFLLDQAVSRSIGAPGVLDSDGVWAATTATVSATVRFQTFSVSVSDGSIAYGVLASNATQSTLPSALNDTQTMTNDGNATENINLRGYDSANWTIVQVDPPGANQYWEQFSTNGFSGFTYATKEYVLVEPNLPASGTATVDFMIRNPSSDTSGGATQDVSLTLQAVAPE